MLRYVLFFSLFLIVPSHDLPGQIRSHPAPGTLLNEPYDVSADFSDFTNIFYVADSLTEFNPVNGSGKIRFQRYRYETRIAFNNMLAVPRPTPPNEFPGYEYAAAPENHFSLTFVSPKTIRLRVTSGPQYRKKNSSLMLVNGFAPQDSISWQFEKLDDGYRFRSTSGSVTVNEDPWQVIIRDQKGKVLTQTLAPGMIPTLTPYLPFSYVRRASDYARRMDAVFSLMPEEKIFGCGESFTGLNKRGQKVVLFTDDPNGVQNEGMYKPIPFFMSNRGYGMFIHTTAPVTCDFGKSFNEATSLMLGDDELDLFIFLGTPKEILDEYTRLTGKAPMPPLWSFGLWMSRISYFSESEGREVADALRVNRIPCDVIHFDTGWFETDWRCDYQFSTSRFRDAARMIRDLKKQGFHISLWQLPYFVPKNNLFPEIVEKGLAIRDPKGNLPTEDAILDFSNPETVAWYQEKIAGLLKMGVGAIKVDFGESAPLNGLYHSGKTGFYEHNYYPLRYNKAAAEITEQIHQEHIIWARSAWAGSQRYPVHWGGDPANTGNAMAATLRGGLSLGISGFSFWSHDMGGFVSRPSSDLYLRWAAFGMFTSHSRTHGAPPREPWEYGPEFMKQFRELDNLRYALMPYIYTQAKACTEKGLPMVRALFIEFPEDPGSWLIDDEYFFGSDMLIAPLFEPDEKRSVYLPPGMWINYQTHREYSGGWHTVNPGSLPIVIMVREGAVIPHIQPAQSTRFLDWSKIRLQVFAKSHQEASGSLYLPDIKQMKPLTIRMRGEEKPILVQDPFHGHITWIIDPVRPK